MRFHLFERSADAHIRKSREYLEEANMGRIEHQAAAEHHSALARMYAERIARIEVEISEVFQLQAASQEPFALPESLKEAGGADARPKSDSVLLYPSRASHA